MHGVVQFLIELSQPIFTIPITQDIFARFSQTFPLLSVIR